MSMEVPSFQGVGIKGFHCIQRCPHFRGLEYRGLTIYRNVLILGGWNRGVSPYKEASSFQEVGIEYGGAFISGGWNKGVPLYQELIFILISSDHGSKE